MHAATGHPGLNSIIPERTNLILEEFLFLNVPLTNDVVPGIGQARPNPGTLTLHGKYVR